MPDRGRPRSFDRDAALRRAMELFWAKGYDGTSLSDLTTAMGINSPSLYAAFRSKQALFREAVRLYGASEGTEIWDAIPNAPTAREAIERFLHRTAESFTRRGKPRGCLIALGALHTRDGSDAVVCRELRDHRAQNAKTLRLRLERGVAEGELSEGFDCRAAATFYATVQHGMSIQARDGASRETLLAVAHCAMAAWNTLVSRSSPSKHLRPPKVRPETHWQRRGKNLPEKTRKAAVPP
ncbi:MAG: TetR family transcriptional regulator [Luteitalea sp.]|nr:TetR family transcriptional regulator [Luteitalea sp.]